MDTLLRNQFLRTVLALCRLSVRADADDIREDVAGECADALEIWSTSLPDIRLSLLKRWSDGVTALLDRLQGQQGVDRALLVRAQLMLLRLQARLPQPAAQPKREEKPKATLVNETKLSGNKTKVLEAVAASPDIRSRDLIGQFKGSMAPRTVKRLLAELTSGGLVARIENEDGNVSYRPSS
ncbi:MAG TPA: hypothetical protein VJ553_06930 [Candidatus Paceibacterota bacterium]|nr:hypothetical protein [Candidatus Paceibacterota bacterium]